MGASSTLRKRYPEAAPRAVLAAFLTRPRDPARFLETKSSPKAFLTIKHAFYPIFLLPHRSASLVTDRRFWFTPFSRHLNRDVFGRDAQSLRCTDPRAGVLSGAIWTMWFRKVDARFDVPFSRATSRRAGKRQGGLGPGSHQRTAICTGTPAWWMWWSF